MLGFLPKNFVGYELDLLLAFSFMILFIIINGEIINLSALPYSCFYVKLTLFVQKLFFDIISFLKLDF